MLNYTTEVDGFNLFTHEDIIVEYTVGGEHISIYVPLYTGLYLKDPTRIVTSKEEATAAVAATNILNMSDEEHDAFVRALLANAINKLVLTLARY